MNLFKQNKSDKKNSPDLWHLLSEFNRSMMLIADKHLLINNFISKIKQISEVSSVEIFLLDENTGKFNLQNSTLKSPHFFNPTDRLISWLSVNEKELIISKNPDIFNYLTPEEQSKLIELKAEMIYPLKVMNHISGMIILGGKINKQSFNNEEINLLSLLFDQATFAIEHASLYEMQTDRIKKMYRTDRLATLGELAAGAAHEIRNPLTAIRSTIQYLSKDFKSDPVKSEMVNELITEVERINKIVQGLLSFSRPSALNLAEVNIEQLINQILLLVNPSIKKNNIQVQFEYFNENMTISGDQEQLKQVFLNIIINAIDAMANNSPESPRLLIISSERGTMVDSKTKYLILTFEDTGSGIPASEIENVFNPFFTTKEEGTGLGLAISYGIINSHGGEIEISSESGMGTCIKIKLPQRI